MNVARLPWNGEPRGRTVKGPPPGGRRAVSGAERRRGGGSPGDVAVADRPSALERPAARANRDVLRRERHQPDFAILIAVVALAAVGILMVYSSSALRAYISRDDTLAIVGPQILWGGLGLLVMVATMRLDYRLLRLVSLPGYLAGLVLLVMVFVPDLNRVVGGSARWLVVGPLPAIHPAEIAKLALIVYLAHWLANRGPLVGRFRGGTVPFLLIALPMIGLVFLEPDLGTTFVIAATAFGMFFLAGASLWQFATMGSLGGLAVLLIGLRGYQADRIRTFLDPWADPLGAGFHTIQGLLALGLGGILGTGLGESKLAGGLYLPNAWNDFIFAVIGEEFGFVGAAIVIALFLVLAYAGLRTARRAPDTFGALLAAGITIWLCFQAFVNIAVVVALLPVTGITLPFVSAGGTSLVVSFAAVGVLLSISRETLEPSEVRPASPAAARPTARSSTAARSAGGRTNGPPRPVIERRSDAPADRRRGNGWPHLPGSRGGGSAPTSRRRR
ncbi:MAG TPA: putative lipid II flippase FtsW [Candidatus Limnocylindrales bacterium]|nr:putative lipid II flippase FtsW [Candidatus Limnocylindrales bacterium]